MKLLYLLLIALLPNIFSIEKIGKNEEKKLYPTEDGILYAYIDTREFATVKDKDDHDDDDEYSYEVACDVDSYCWCDNNCSPSGAFDGSIEDIGGNSFEVRLEGIAVFIYQIGSLA